MANYRNVSPVIRWGTPNLQNAVYFPFPLDPAFSGPEPRDGSETIAGPDGGEDAWTVGTNNVLAGTGRWISAVDTIFYPRCTGWDGAIGLQGALTALRDKQPFPWHPDGRNLLRYPTLTSALIDRTPGTGGYAGWSSASTGSVTGVTVSFDAGTGAWKIVGTSTGVTQYVHLLQRFPGIPGEQFWLSADYKVSGLGGSAAGALYVNALDSALVYINTPGGLQGLTNTSFVRAITPQSAVMPANTAYVECHLRLELPNNGSTGTIWFRNAMVRRDSGDSTFLDNPFVDGCFLVDPYQFAPANESDGSRQLVFKIRNPSTQFAGY